MKTETYKLYFRDFWIFLPNIIKIDHYNSELYRLVHFLRHSVVYIWDTLDSLPVLFRLNAWQSMMWDCEHRSSTHRHTFELRSWMESAGKDEQYPPVHLEPSALEWTFLDLWSIPAISAANCCSETDSSVYSRHYSAAKNMPFCFDKVRAAHQSRCY